jgi:hypothetical protein
MATPLRCPHCAADFDFAAWQKAASCPACGRRVRFEDAVASAAAAPAPTVTAAGPGATATGREAAVSMPTAVGPTSPAPATTHAMAAAAAVPVSPAVAAGDESAASSRYLFGRPLRWTRAWTAVLLVWAVAASGLVIARVEAGHGAVLTSRERGAIAAVQRAPLESGLAYGEALRRVEKRLGVSSASARWYVQDRSWEKELAVHRVLGGDDLSWTVGYGGKVAPDPGTASILEDLMKAGTGQPGGLPSLPSIPSL